MQCSLGSAQACHVVAVAGADGLVVTRTVHEMMPREGTMIADRYRLERKVGGGRVSAVWRVHDQITDVTCAVKLLHRSMHKHSEALTRFSLEDRLARELTGPHFPERVGSGSWEGLRYIAWRWHEGESLRALFDRNPKQDAPTVHSIVQETCQALTGVHAAGYTHGDLKPENLYFADRGENDPSRQLKLIGFGVAARIAPFSAAGANRKRPGQLVGTPLYMSPDLILGRMPRGGQADLWALAVLVYEALTGRAPFLGSDLGEVLEAILKRDAPRPSSVADTLPGTFDLWWAQAVEQEFNTPAEFASSLARALGPALRSSHTQRSASLPERLPVAGESANAHGATATGLGSVPPPGAAALASTAASSGASGSPGASGAHGRAANGAGKVNGSAALAGSISTGSISTGSAGPGSATSQGSASANWVNTGSASVSSTLVGTGAASSGAVSSAAAATGSVAAPVASGAGAAVAAASAAGVSASPTSITSSGMGPAVRPTASRALDAPPREAPSLDSTSQGLGEDGRFAPLPSPLRDFSATASRKTLVGITPPASLSAPPVSDALGTALRRSVEISAVVPVHDGPAAALDPFRRPASPTVPFPRPRLLPRLPAPMGEATPMSLGGAGNTWRGPTTRTLRFVLTSPDHRPQRIAAVLVCAAAALVIFVVGRSPVAGTAAIGQATGALSADPAIAKPAAPAAGATAASPPGAALEQSPEADPALPKEGEEALGLGGVPEGEPPNVNGSSPARREPEGDEQRATPTLQRARPPQPALTPRGLAPMPPELAPKPRSDIKVPSKRSNPEPPPPGKGGEFDFGI